jgi:N-acetylglucosaminyldiphosphoundecaprenol N-acetyl-beta-D-mannosaminyltransferase
MMVGRNPSQSTADRPRPDTEVVFGIPFTSLSFEEVVDAIVEGAGPGDGARLVFTTNVDHVVQMARRPEFRDAYEKAWTRTIDGTPVYVYAKVRGRKIEKITGADVLPEVCERLSPARHRVFMVCSNEVTGQGAQARFMARGFGAEAIAFDVPPFGFENDRAYSDALADRIREHGTTHLFFCVGAPKSEIWLAQHRDRLGDCVGMAWGAALDFWVGTKKRAPKTFSRWGLEWAWRLGTEPRRLAKRYLVDSWRFGAAIIEDLRS